MKLAVIAGAATVVVSALMLGLGYQARLAATPRAAIVEQPQAPPASGRAAIETIVRDYLIANPEVMLEVQTALKDKQELAQRAAQIDVIKTSAAQIFSAAEDGVIGNPQGTTTIVEFFDYNCGFCKRAVADMDALVAADPDLRVVMKEFPILGPDSTQAHIVSGAFRRLMPEKWPQFHAKLIRASGRAGEASAIAVALSLGADEAALREAMKSPEIARSIEQTYGLAEQLEITGTPSYVVGNEVVFGALGQEVLSEKVAMARACKDGAC